MTQQHSPALTNTETAIAATENARLISYSVNSHGKNKDWDYEALTTGFQDKVGTFTDLKAAIKAGYATTGAHFKGQRRKTANVSSVGLLLVDVDGGMTMDEAKANPFIQQFCAIAYTTHSHKPELHKFRLIFPLSQVMGRSDFECLVKIFLGQFPHDPSCKDAGRAFYGNTEAEFFIDNPDAVLPLEWIEQAIAEAKEEKERKEKERQERAEWLKNNPLCISHNAIPLINCCRKEVRQLVSDGVPPSSGHNNAAIAVLSELIGVERYLAEIGQPTDPARYYYDQFLAASGVSDHKAEQRWEWGESKDFSPSLTPEMIDNCIKAWEYKQIPKSERRNFCKRHNFNPKPNNPGDLQTPQSGKDGDRLPENKWKGLSEYNSQFGYWKEKEVDGQKVRYFDPVTDFVFTIVQILESKETGGGYILAIERIINGEKVTEPIQIDSNDCIRPTDFCAAINKALGVSLTCIAKHTEIQKTFQAKKAEYYAKGESVYKLADRHGCQGDNQPWVFKNGQIDPQGNPTNETETKLVFNAQLSTGEEQIPAPVLAERNPEALKKLTDAARDFSGDNFPLFLAVMGYGVMSAHFQTIIKEEGAFPILNPYGDPGGMKSVFAACAASLFGSNWATDGIVAHLSDSALYERLKSIGNLLIGYDDPKRDAMLDELLKRLYNALARVVRGNIQAPHSPIMVMTNHACGDDSAATRTRLIRLFVPVVKMTESAKLAYPRLKEAQRQASGALPDIIKLGYPKAKIDALESGFIAHLPGAHIRIAKSLAQLTYYTQAFCELAGVEFDFKQWAIANLCPAENDADANKNSLDDFLDKVAILRGRNALGEWNVKNVTREGKDYLAVVLGDVWSAVDKEFDPPYSLSSIKALIKQKGGLDNQPRKFHPDRDISLKFQGHLLVNPDATPPKLKSKRCYLIPVEPDYFDYTGDYKKVVESKTSGESVSGSVTTKTTKTTFYEDININKKSDSPGVWQDSSPCEGDRSQEVVSVVSVVSDPDPLHSKPSGGYLSDYTDVSEVVSPSIDAAPIAPPADPPEPASAEPLWAQHNLDPYEVLHIGDRVMARCLSDYTQAEIVHISSIDGAIKLENRDADGTITWTIEYSEVRRKILPPLGGVA